MGLAERRRFLLTSGLLLGAPLIARAQGIRAYAVGIVHLGGEYSAAVDGLRDGLKELGLNEGKQVKFLAHNLKGDRRSADSAARSLERQKVDLIYSVTTSVSIAVKRATNNVPVVFYAGTDPVRFGLVQSLARPGGRFTGIYSQITSLMAKRLEVLKEMIPGLRRVAYFYDPRNPLAEEVTQAQRVAARQLDLQLVERSVDSAAALKASLNALKPGDVDAVAYVDSLVVSQTAMVIEIANAKRLAVMAPDRASVAEGALASYGVSYYRAGRLAAKQVERILHGAAPSDLPVEQMDRLHFAINLKAAGAIGLAIPQSVLVQADEVVE
ncbi:MAG TPA: ABC transporter substrate-binding protein [Burkholderiales bacterium]|nr:ABC transporter substrate-binding protein [Burkholderiales bacterium]